ncbi:BPSS1780 family membrane protein [Uliginosibacterium aquaticum]|uniref:Transmembrane protein n=1 Tax=Uliginosibacterium aquaticum TaxID=2731212 RepID=A0ABX2IS30_9RHOO|nr:BPSS1780 family membrane protein [Uliginosibacterium aquaticum]NSL57023.1 hypothetical protein [Uliginosibacterium aquaticum]
MQTQGNNPYAPPAAIVEDEQNWQQDGQYIPGGRTVSAGRGVSWFGMGWEFFKQSPLGWIVLLIVFGVLWMVVSMIPLVNLLAIVLFPVLNGGVMIACENQRRNGSLAIGDLFAGFQQKFGPLAILGLISFGVMLVSMIPVIAIMGFGFASALMGGQQIDPSMIMGMMGSFGLAMLLMVVVSMLMYSALWFAPALITLQNLSPVEAIKASFAGCWKNFLAGLVYFITATILMILGAIPLGLGLLVVLPMLMVSIYAGYRDIFIEE